MKHVYNNVCAVQDLSKVTRMKSLWHCMVTRGYFYACDRTFVQCDTSPMKVCSVIHVLIWTRDRSHLVHMTLVYCTRCQKKFVYSGTLITGGFLQKDTSDRKFSTVRRVSQENLYTVPLVTETFCSATEVRIFF